MPKGSRNASFSRFGLKSPLKSHVFPSFSTHPFSFPYRQVLWILSETSDGLGLLRLVDQRLQRSVASWPLPSGRWWAPGLCRHGGGFLLPAAAEVKSKQGPELWRFRPQVGERGTSESRSCMLYIM